MRLKFMAIAIRRLPQSRWLEYRALRLEALRTEPTAFSSSYGEELRLTQPTWRGRMHNVIFALDGRTPIGIITLVFGSGRKTCHTAKIYGFYVRGDYRSKGIGALLVRRALGEARAHGGIAKVGLAVNPLQRPAARLYKREGFTVIGRMRKGVRTGDRSIDELIMELEL